MKPNPIITNRNDLICQQYLKLLYRKSYHHLPNQTISETYGEILYESVNQLIQFISFSEQDVFFDLGSGLGKVVIQIFLNSAVKEAWGIEIIPELHYYASLVAENVKQQFPCFFDNERKLTFLLGNFLDLSLARANVVLIASPCFTPQMFFQLATHIEQHENIHTVLSLRPLLTLKRLRFIKAIRIQGSWDSALCYLYQM